MSRSVERAIVCCVIALFCFGLCRSAQFRYQDKILAIQNANAEARAKLNLPMPQLKQRYPTPEISMVTCGCLLPGQTADVVARGKFAPDSKFVFENDSIDVVKEALAGNEYRATVRAAPDAGPMAASLRVFTPVSSIQAAFNDAVTVGGRYEFALDAKNGWKVVAATAAGSICGQTQMSAIVYDVKFFKSGQAQPFETRTAKLSYSQWDAHPYLLHLSDAPPNANDPAQKMAAIVQKMSDPKLTPAQRQAVMQQLMKAQTDMQAQTQQMSNVAAAQARAAEMEKQKAAFGCEYIDLLVKAGAATGRLRCGSSVGQVDVSGTMKLLGR